TYEMLAGHLPFESQDPAVLREAVLHETAEQIPDLSKTAQNALIKAMSKDPPERFASCAEFIAALSGKKIAGNGKSNAKWIGLISGAVLLVLILAGSGIYLHQQKTAKENAKAQRLAALKQQEKADQEKQIAKENALKKAEEERIAKEKAVQEKREAEAALQAKIKAAEDARKANELALRLLAEKEKALKKAEEERIAKENAEKQRQAVLKQPTPKREENFSAGKKSNLRQGSNEEQSLAQAEILKQAEQLYDIKAYSEALGFYNKLTGELPLENLMHKGECFEKIKSYGQAILCYRQAERRGFNDSDCRLGILSEKRGEWKDAVESYSELVERKNYHAAYRLALIYLNGKGGFVEPQKGYELLKLAADSGYVQAQYILGCSYAKFRGTDKFTIIKYDLDKAQQYLQKAKINGHKEAGNRLKFLGGN
ncbi:MAG: SEL1-like repeat protein, partial [Lentisphaeria bacterium]|nr:SEL1-like repeat protein [Lentisphaeria bacterium]